MYCAPNRNGSSRLTCYTKSELNNIANNYNNYIKDSNDFIKISGRTKEDIWRQLREKLSNMCDNEICWIDRDFMKHLDRNERIKMMKNFRPKMPEEWKQNPTTWLTTTDISSAMNLYEDQYKDFLFIGPVPLDCGVESTLRCQLTNIDISKLFKKGIKQIGIIYNSDVSTGDGEHWMAVYVDMKKHNDISFYDSFGRPPKPEILQTMNKFKQQMTGNLDLNITVNKKRHQFDSYNCGVYSMNYIINRLKGKSLNDIMRMNLPTQKMQELKKYLYRPY